MRNGMEGRRPASDELGVASPSLPHSAVGSDEPAPAASVYLECSCTRACHRPCPRPLNADNDPNVVLASNEEALHVGPNPIPGYGGCLLRHAAAGRGESDRGFDRVVFGEWRISLQAPRGGPALASSSIHLSAPRDVLSGDLDAARRRNELGPRVRSRHGWDSITSGVGALRSITHGATSSGPQGVLMPLVKLSQCGNEVFQRGYDRAAAPDDECLHLQVDSHSLLSCLAEVGAQSEASLFESGSVAKLGGSTGIWLLTIENRNEQRAGMDRDCVPPSDLKGHLAELPRRTGFADFRRRRQRPGVYGCNDSGERWKQNAVIVVTTCLAEAKRTRYIAAPRLPEWRARHVIWDVIVIREGSAERAHPSGGLTVGAASSTDASPPRIGEGPRGSRAIRHRESIATQGRSQGFDPSFTVSSSSP